MHLPIGHSRFRRRSFLATALIAALLLTQTACKEVETISEFAGKASAMAGAYAEIAADSRRSLRFQNYMQNAEAEPPLSISKAYSNAVAQAEADSISASIAGFESASEVLSDYFAAMSALGSKNLVAFDDRVQNVTGRLDKAARIKPEEKAAVTKLATFLFNGLAGYKQRKALRSAIQDNDDAVGKSIAAMETAAQVHLELLQNEETTLRIYLDGPATDLKTKLDAPANPTPANLEQQANLDAVLRARLTRATTLPIREAAFNALQNLERQRGRQKAFAGMLQKVKQVHHELATTKAEFNAMEISQHVAQGASALNSALKAFQ